MATKEDLLRELFIFTTEVFNGLNRLYNIEFKLSTPYETPTGFFNSNILGAIATISFVLRNYSYKTFLKYDENLKKKTHFREICRCISAERDQLYFFHFLRRVSFIYDMSVYCYRKNNNYFSTARECIVNYEDKEYFKSQGSWEGLRENASFLHSIGHPFLEVIMKEGRIDHPIDFAAVLENMESRLKTEENNVILYSHEMSFLPDEEKNIGRERDEETKNIDLQVEKSSANEVKFRRLKESLLDYLLRWKILDPKVFTKLKELLMEGAKYESSGASKPLEPLELRKSRTDTESTEEYDYLTTDQAYSSSKKLTADMHFLSNPSVDEQLKVPEGTQVSGDKDGIYQSSPSCSYFPTPSNNTRTEESKTRKPSLLEEDLDLSGSFLADENLQQHPGATGNCSLPAECGSYSSNESIISKSRSLKKQVSSSDNTTCDSKILQEDLYLSESSSEDKYIKQSSVKNMTYSRRKHEYRSRKLASSGEHGPCSSSDSNASNYQSKLIDQYLYNSFPLLSLSDSHISENVTSQESTLKVKCNEDNSAMLEDASNRSPEFSLDLSIVQDMIKDTSEMFKAEMKAGFLAISDAIGTIQRIANEREREKTKSKSSKPVADTEEESCNKMSKPVTNTEEESCNKMSKPVTDTEEESCNKIPESDSDTAGKDSLTSSKTRKNSKGKKGKKSRRKR